MFLVVTALFRSLLYEAVGRTVNPVNGAVGLLWTGNWKVCQSAVETVLRGGTLYPLPEYLAGSGGEEGDDSDRNACSDYCYTEQQRRSVTMDEVGEYQPAVAADQPELCLTMAKPREATPSEESGTTTLGSSSVNFTTISIDQGGSRRKLLRFFI